jgi:hypothetical protein
MGRKKINPDAKTITTKREILFDLTEQDRAARLEACNTLESQIEKINAEIKEFKDSRKEEVRLLTIERTKVRRVLASNNEARSVVCKQIMDYRAGSVTTTYKGRITEVREMLDHERQTEIPVETKSARKTKEKTDAEPKAKKTPKSRNHVQDIEAPTPISNAAFSANPTVPHPAA